MQELTVVIERLKQREKDMTSKADAFDKEADDLKAKFEAARKAGWAAMEDARVAGSCAGALERMAAESGSPLAK